MTAELPIEIWHTCLCSLPNTYNL